MIIVITGALVPTINVVIQAGDFLHLASSILGGVIVVITATTQVLRKLDFVQNNTGATEEKFLYLNDAGDYARLDPENKKRQLVERI